VRIYPNIITFEDIALLHETTYTCTKIFDTMAHHWNICDPPQDFRDKGHVMTCYTTGSEQNDTPACEHCVKWHA